MVDSEVYYMEVASAKSAPRPILGDCGDTTEFGVSKCLCHVCLNSKQRGIQPKISRYSNYDDLFPETTKSLTNHQYFLCAPEVHAYVFKSRAWGKGLLVDELF